MAAKAMKAILVDKKLDAVKTDCSKYREVSLIISVLIIHNL